MAYLVFVLALFCVSFTAVVPEEIEYDFDATLNNAEDDIYQAATNQQADNIIKGVSEAIRDAELDPVHHNCKFLGKERNYTLYNTSNLERTGDAVVNNHHGTKTLLTLVRVNNLKTVFDWRQSHRGKECRGNVTTSTKYVVISTTASLNVSSGNLQLLTFDVLLVGPVHHDFSQLPKIIRVPLEIAAKHESTATRTRIAQAFRIPIRRRLQKVLNQAFITA